MLKSVCGAEEKKKKKNEIFIIWRQQVRGIGKQFAGKPKGKRRRDISRHLIFPPAEKTSIKLAQVHSPTRGCLPDESLMDTTDLSGAAKLT